MEYENLDIGADVKGGVEVESDTLHQLQLKSAYLCGTTKN
jgi:hypothetical protein